LKEQSGFSFLPAIAFGDGGFRTLETFFQWLESGLLYFCITVRQFLVFYARFLQNDGQQNDGKLQLISKERCNSF